MTNMKGRSDFLASLTSGELLFPSGAQLAIAEWEAPGTPPGEEPMWIAPLHLHHHDDEAWYVLQGTLSVRVGDEIVTAKQGEAVIVPQGTPHTFWNPSSEPTRYLIIMQGQIQPLIEAIHRLEQRDLETMQGLFRQHGSELLG
jgi:mannose-6-phosphate isomerase-like protein (cupin superfamily)